MASPGNRKKIENGANGMNHLVAALSAGDQEFFLAKTSKVELTVGLVLSEPNDPQKFAYFPNSGVISIVSLMRSGSGAEVGLIGSEGMVGVGFLLGGDHLPHQALVQGPGDAYRIAVADLLTLCDGSRKANALLLRFTGGFLNFVAQGAACNALHSAEERLARWILLVQDRLHKDAVPITHEFIANMLGTRRATVTVVANVLEHQGLIALGRREIRVLNRDGLLKASCECYSAMRDATSSHVI
jgi:CRP-like cAMP-binding protein